MAHPRFDAKACDAGRVIALPRGHRVERVVRSGVALALAVGLAACSSPSTGEERPPPVLLSPSAPASAGPTPAPTAATPLAVELDPQWAAAATDTGGYRLDLEPTRSPGVFDGHFYRQAADGAVSGRQVVTITVTAADAVEVRWPDGTSTPGRLTLAGSGRGRTELALDPGCLDYLVDGSSQLDCRLYPVDEFGPTASAVPTPSAVAPPPSEAIALPDADEAMGYLCSVSNPGMIDHVTGPDADPYTTAVLQSALAAAGRDPGEIDGVYGPTTRRAVRAFQRSAGLAVDGLVGPRTWTALQSAVCTLASDPAGQ